MPSEIPVMLSKDRCLVEHNGYLALLCQLFFRLSKTLEVMRFMPGFFHRCRHYQCDWREVKASGTGFVGHLNN